MGRKQKRGSGEKGVGREKAPKSCLGKEERKKKKINGIKWTFTGKIPAMKEPFKEVEKQEL